MVTKATDLLNEASKRANAVERTYRIELVRSHPGSWEDLGPDPGGIRTFYGVPPHDERGPYPCGCTTCDGHFVMVEARCSGTCGCTLTALEATPTTGYRHLPVRSFRCETCRHYSGEHGVSADPNRRRVGESPCHHSDGGQVADCPCDRYVMPTEAREQKP